MAPYAGMSSKESVVQFLNQNDVPVDKQQKLLEKIRKNQLVDANDPAK